MGEWLVNVGSTYVDDGRDLGRRPMGHQFTRNIATFQRVDYIKTPTCLQGSTAYEEGSVISSATKLLSKRKGQRG
jgi:hypothetical protein